MGPDGHPIARFRRKPMTQRTDIHRPSAINPADYDFIAYEVLPTPAFDPGAWQYMAEQRRRI